MNASPNKECQPLEEWLSLATSGLVRSAQERVRQELEAHFSDAVEARMAEGLSRDAAQVAAVRELGDARRAAWNFRKNLLMESEARTLFLMQDWHHKRGTYRGRRRSIQMFAAIAVLWLTSLHDASQFWREWWSFLAIGGAVFSLAGFLVTRLMFRGLFKEPCWSLPVSQKYLACGMVSDAFGASALVPLWLAAHPSSIVAVALSLGVLGFLCISEVGKFRLWIKLGRILNSSLRNA